MMSKILSKSNLKLAGVFLAGVIASGIVRRKIPGAAKLPAIS